MMRRAKRSAGSRARRRVPPTSPRHGPQGKKATLARPELTTSSRSHWTGLAVRSRSMDRTHSPIPARRLGTRLRHGRDHGSDTHRARPGARPPPDRPRPVERWCARRGFVRRCSRQATARSDSTGVPASRRSRPRPHRCTRPCALRSVRRSSPRSTMNGGRRRRPRPRPSRLRTPRGARRRHS